MGRFVALLNDVGADIGILVSQMGYTKAAKTRAQKSRVKLDIKTVEELREYRVTFDYCEECDPGEDHLSGLIHWGGHEELRGDVNAVLAVGHCDWCNSLHLRRKCDAVTGIPEALHGEPVECMGGCGTTFLVTERHAGHGMTEYFWAIQRAL